MFFLREIQLAEVFEFKPLFEMLDEPKVLGLPSNSILSRIRKPRETPKETDGFSKEPSTMVNS